MRWWGLVDRINCVRDADAGKRAYESCAEQNGAREKVRVRKQVTTAHNRCDLHLSGHTQVCVLTNRDEIPSEEVSIFGSTR